MLNVFFFLGSLIYFFLTFNIFHFFLYVFSCACNEIVSGTSPARDDKLLCDLS